MKYNIITNHAELTNEAFIEEIYELAFGDDAINRDFSHGEVIEKIKEFTEDSYKWEQQQECE